MKEKRIFLGDIAFFWLLTHMRIARAVVLGERYKLSLLRVIVPLSSNKARVYPPTVLHRLCLFTTLMQITRWEA